MLQNKAQTSSQLMASAAQACTPHLTNTAIRSPAFNQQQQKTHSIGRIQPWARAVSDGPVDEVGVHILQLQLLQGALECRQHILSPVVVVPQLASDEEIPAPDNALLALRKSHL